MKRCKDIIVTKHDGSLEGFSLSKLSNALATVLQGRSYDPRLSRPLARAIGLHLRGWAELTPPTTEYIHRCVCSVLQQTGLGEVADDLASHRRLRAARRRRVRVLDRRESTQRGRRWQKVELVETLESRYGLRHAVSRFLAGQIEAQVFALNYRLISETFLAELVRNEMLAWGLADGRVSQIDTPAGERPVGTRRPEKEN